MNSKVKLFFIFLAVMAVVSVFSFFDVFGGARSAKLTDTTKPLLPVEEDLDQDGLANADESYWNTDSENPDTDGDGYLDGEEVASGFDPKTPNSTDGGDNLKDILGWSPQPVDVTSADFNLTDNFTGLVAGGIAAGDLMPNTDPTKKDEAINYLSLAIIDDFYKTQNFQPPSIKTIDDSNENQVQYLNSLSKTIKDDLISLSPTAPTLNLGVSSTDQKEYFTNKSQQFNLSFNKVAGLEVPKDWLEIHKNILSILHRFSLDYQFIAFYETDPMKAITALNEIVNLNMETQTLLNQIQFKIETNKLTLSDDIYQVLNLIYKSRE